MSFSCWTRPSLKALVRYTVPIEVYSCSFPGGCVLHLTEDEDKGRDKSPSETSHSSHSDHDNEETDKEEPADGGEGDESDSSSGGGTTEATPSGEPVTSSGSGGGISAGAAAGIAVGGVVAAAAAFLAGRRTRTQSGTAGPTVAEPTVFRKPESGSTTSHAASNPDMGAPSSASTDMDVVESSSRMDRV